MAKTKHPSSEHHHEAAAHHEVLPITIARPRTITSTGATPKRRSTRPRRTSIAVMLISTLPRRMSIHISKSIKKD